ncbi:RBBP9/YdeN family alpha/beta hydrolase [Rhodobacter capsulatus]|uniref:RBBP9/YdeN family alpha/beta hydrolase n=1 Tax=Rhodobacter capsulatus TaxID=1061 RepID=UPI0003D30EBB|nr:alpha/beta hydrolase [Rhodobacter capsulatus]ETD81347.1 hypothetical protein U703_16145 [Rhodobacter capsulatus YW1]ETD89130.1 hypothetical protein U713_10325 [Rhodobacter capsulatus YW2]
MIKTLLVPGLDGSPAPHWQDWWAATDPTALMVDLPCPDRPMPDLWEAELAGMVLQHPNAVLVGHSLGAVLVARLLSKWPQIEVRAAMFVAPADTRGARRIGHFGSPSRRALPVPSLLVASRNDPWMSFARASELATAWGSELVDLGASGHINVAAGFGPWPAGKALRDRLLGRLPRPVEKSA